MQGPEARRPCTLLVPMEPPAVAARMLKETTMNTLATMDAILMPYRSMIQPVHAQGERQGA